MVYVLNMQGQPLMPCKESKARKLLRDNLAIVVKREPFTIQLIFECENQTQDITLGVDAGSKHIGLSATTNKKELYAADVELRTDIIDLLSTRRQNRRTRRNRLRYRKPRFNNRVKSKNKGWLAPSIENKIQTHFNIVEKIHKILPITKIIVETASFDIQKIEKPEIQGKEYQQGETQGFENLREYVFWRDNYTCQWCKGKSKDPVLHIHHWNYWNGDHTDKPSSTITLCHTCNDSKNHKPEANMLWGWKPKITNSYRDAAFMGIMRWTFYNRLKEIYGNVKMTYGYITKNTRINNKLPKEHYIDALCITNNPKVERLGYYYYIKQVRKHNRQIHKANILKGGVKKLNQAPYFVKGFRLFDKVKYDNQECFIFGRRSSGYFDLRKLDGTNIHKSASYKKLNLLQPRQSLLVERRMAIPALS